MGALLSFSQQRRRRRRGTSKGREGEMGSRGAIHDFARLRPDTLTVETEKKQSSFLSFFEDVGIAQWLGAHDCKPNDQSSIHVGDEFLEFS